MLNKNETEKLLKLKKEGNLLIILVGKSGSGKNSFMRAMKLDNCSYEISERVKKELEEKGQPINHDTIQPIMHQRYEENSYWQIPYILNEIKKKGLLIVNGCRSFLEIKKLKELCSWVLIVEVRASASARKKRLSLRDGTSQSGFRKIELDEMKVTDLPKILQDDLVDIVIMNNNSLDALKIKAKMFAFLISPFKHREEESKYE